MPQLFGKNINVCPQGKLDGGVGVVKTVEGSIFGDADFTHPSGKSVFNSRCGSPVNSQNGC
jgi:hypothetical protein